MGCPQWGISAKHRAVVPIGIQSSFCSLKRCQKEASQLYVGLLPGPQQQAAGLSSGGEQKPQHLCLAQEHPSRSQQIAVSSSCGSASL